MSDSLVATNRWVPEKYNVLLDVDVHKPNFHGALEFVLKNSTTSAHSQPFHLVLHAAKLVVLGATVNGHVVQVKNNPTNTTVELSSDSLPPADYTGSLVHIKYLGTIKTLNSFEQTKGVFKFEIDDRVLIATQTQPSFARMIYPCIDEPAFKVPMKLTVKTAKGLQVVGNNAVESEEVDPTGGTKTVSFVATPPMLSSNFAFTIGDLQYVESTKTSVPIRVYCLREFGIKAPQVLAIAEKLVPLLTSRFGSFPLQKLDIIGVPYLTEGAMENWGAITVMQDYLFKDDVLQTQQLVAHELVHQWIGNLVSFDDWKYVWLNESFATFFGNHFVSIIDPSYSFVEELIDMSGRMVRTGDVNIQKFMNGVRLTGDTTTGELFNHQVYEKGILMLRMIGNILDPNTIDNFEVFLASMSKFVEAHRFESIKASEIWQFFLQEFDIDLLTFVSMWIRYDKFPFIQVSQKNGELVIEQAQSKPYQFPLVVSTTERDYQFYIKDKTTKVKLDEQVVAVNKHRVALVKQDISKKLVKDLEPHLGRLDALSYLIDYPDSGSGVHQMLQGVLRKQTK